MHLAELFRDHGAGEDLRLTQLVGSLLQDHRWLDYHILGRDPVELILDRFPCLNDFLESSAQIFDLKVCASDGALILLSVIVIGIYPLVILEVYIVGIIVSDSFSCHSYLF